MEYLVSGYKIVWMAMRYEARNSFVNRHMYVYVGQHLLGALTHLSSFTTEASHALFAPLGTHSTVDAAQHGQGIGFTDAIISQVSRLEKTR